jgi:hypothetical protein
VPYLRLNNKKVMAQEKNELNKGNGIAFLIGFALLALLVILWLIM